MSRLTNAGLALLVFALLLFGQSVFPPAGGGASAFKDLSGAATDAQIPNDITIDLATKASALSANGANCSAGNYPLGVDASGAAESCTAAPVPGGTVLAPVAIASVPAAGTAGRFQLFTDSPLQAYDNGASWDYYLPGAGKITRPPTSTSAYTLLNSVGIAVQEGGWLVTAADGTNNLRMAYQAAGYPATSYSITIGIRARAVNNFMTAGLAVSDGTKYTYCGRTVDTSRYNGVADAAQNWTNNTTFSANIGTLRIATPSDDLVFFTLTDDLSATMACWVSNDINNLTSGNASQIFSIGRTSFMTPSRVGVYAMTGSSPGAPAAMLILHMAGTGGFTP